MTSKSIFRFALTFCLVSAFFSPLVSADDALKALGQLPVQNGGRIKPFDSFARETVLSVTGKRSIEKQSPTQTVWLWMSETTAWNIKPFLPASYKALAQELGGAVQQGKISPQNVLSNAQLLQEVENAVRRQDRKEKLSALDQKRIELVSRARLFEALGEKQLPGMIPSSHNIKEHWLVPQDFASQTSAFSSPASLVAFINEQFQNHGIQLDRSKLDLEYTYNRVHFFRWAWMLYLASLLLAGWKVGQKKWPAALVLVGGAFLLHTTGFIFRCLIAGRPPVSNMYESVIWVSWAAVAFSWILYLFYRNHLAVMVASCVAIAGLLVGDGLPAVLDASLSPLVPVLKSNYWLTIHVLTITLSYGAFALAWGLAHAVLFNFAFRRRDTEKLKDLSLLLQRTLQIGVVLLAAGTILGGVWANYSWGRFWGWDPKETWALIALLGYLALLHGRYVGWWGAFGTAVGSLLAFFGIVMAWYGVNFVLAAGLHSYGFGVGGFPYVLAIIGADLTLLVFLVLKSKQAAT